ncbi:hypothetical protein Y032_0142g2314 [Ancylostoma ceylanicum]|uniref:Uncharacterized protein n=1 Tax=Ancylostoma ceylanicum TaxID=53326 RepID=A0A016T3N7_9BILA|nr:hypothetical protein Y032_0142g2314 [Ancylostoma ceylanicum]
MWFTSDNPKNFTENLILSLRWAQKCRAVWRPLPDYTPADYGEYAPQPLVRGQFYGYDALGTLIQILSRIRGCAARPVQAVGWRSGLK